MLEWRWVIVHACLPPVTSPDSLSLCHTHTVAHRLLPGPPLLLDIQSDTPPYKTLSCHSNPPSHSLYASVSPSCPLCCHVFPALGFPVCRSWWSGVECGEEGGGRPAEKGLLNCSHTQQTTPYWSVAHLAIWGGQSKGCREMEIQTLSPHTHTHTHSHTHTHTAIELMLHPEHTKRVKEGNLTFHSCWRRWLPEQQIRSNMAKSFRPPNKIHGTKAGSLVQPIFVFTVISRFVLDKW